MVEGHGPVTTKTLRIIVTKHCAEKWATVGPHTPYRLATPPHLRAHKKTTKAAIAKTQEAREKQEVAGLLSSAP